MGRFSTADYRPCPRFERLAEIIANRRPATSRRLRLKRQFCARAHADPVGLIGRSMRSIGPQRAASLCNHKYGLAIHGFCNYNNQQDHVRSDEMRS